MTTLSGKTLFITGASRGIGLAIALRAARDGANVAIAAKSSVPNPKLPGTIHSAAAAVAATVDAFGGIDILVNNASAIWLRDLWFRTGKPVYRFITRRLLKWEDNEGQGPKP